MFSSEVAVSVAREAVQVHGGYGFMDESPVSRFYRDAKILEIGEGTVHPTVKLLIGALNDTSCRMPVRDDLSGARQCAII